MTPNSLLKQPRNFSGLESGMLLTGQVNHTT
uniref:Uncharacterized protein n=1 Tax=Anguilla anguilla TaxID=7936 RepID=A0A0E9RN99_ANGAN